VLNSVVFVFVITKWRFGGESDLCQNRSAGKHKRYIFLCFYAMLLPYVLIPTRMSDEENLGFGLKPLVSIDWSSVCGYCYTVIS
jgi:hypothetical protein